MSAVDAFYFGWYMDDGSLWFWHICVDGLDDWKAPPPWRLVRDGELLHPGPSLDCKKCGRHTILFASDERTPPSSGADPETTPPAAGSQDNKPMNAPHYKILDAGIAPIVSALQAAGVDTYESCEGGEGHASRDPYVRLYGLPADQWRALAVCLDHGFDVASIARQWDIDNGEPSGPYTHITFRSLPASRTPEVKS